MKSKLFWAVTACALICSLPVSAFAACTGADPSTAEKVYQCICDKWEVVKETTNYKGCDNKDYKNTVSWGWDKSTCASVDYERKTHESVSGQVDSDCSSYTPTTTDCCIAIDNWYYKPSTTPGARETWNWGVRCENKSCPKGSVKSIDEKNFGTPYSAPPPPKP